MGTQRQGKLGVVRTIGDIIIDWQTWEWKFQKGCNSVSAKRAIQGRYIIKHLGLRSKFKDKLTHISCI